MPVDWRRLRQLADSQCGLVTRAQCLAAGMTEDAVRWRVFSRRWERVHLGVFQTRPGREGADVAMLAVLLRAQSDALAADAALCGRSAGYLWGLVATPGPHVEIVVPQRRTVRLDGVRVSRSMRWDGLIDERAYPWRTTRVATLLELAGRGTGIDALSLVARAIQREQVGPAEVLREIVARGGHRHSRLLKAALREAVDGAESGAEVLYIRDVERAHGLPVAVRQAPGPGAQRRDNDYVAYGLVVEVDGRLGHELWSDRVRDGRRDRRTLAGRQVTTRVFFSDVALTPCATADDIGRILRSRGWDGRPRRCRRAGCAIS